MSKVWLGVVLGAMLGLVDGASAKLYPEVTWDMMAGIVIGSTFKGLVAGAVAGWYATRSSSLGKGVLVGLAVAFVLSLAVVIMGVQANDPAVSENKLGILLPGTALGAIVGFATQKYGAARAAA